MTKGLLNLFFAGCLTLLVAGCGDFVTTDQVLEFNDSIVEISEAQDKPVVDLAKLVSPWLSGKKVSLDKINAQYAKCESANSTALTKINGLKTPNSPECLAFKEAYLVYINSTQDFLASYKKAIALIGQHNPAPANITQAIDDEMATLEANDDKNFKAIDSAQKAMAKRYNFKLE